MVLVGRDPAAQAELLASPGLAEPGFWSALSELAMRHGLLGVLLLQVERHGGLTDEQRQSLRMQRRQAALWDLERDYLLDLLAQAGIPVLLLKGAALRLTAYQHSVERPFGDLDVLVPERWLDRAVALLSEAGYRGQPEERARQYRERHHHLILQKDLGFVVELHWALEPPGSPFRLDPAAFEREARTVAGPQGPIRVPSPEHFVLHLATQNAEDGFSRLGRMVDLDRVIAGAGGEFDWDALAADAVRMQVNGVVALSLRLAALLLDTPVPAGLLDRLQVSGTVRSHLAMLDPVGSLLEQRAMRRPGQHRLLLLWSIPDPATRRRVREALSEGEYDWFQAVQPSWSSRRMAATKLRVYQLAMQLRGLGARYWGPRRVSRFWG